jgi:hypothetical protein
MLNAQDIQAFFDEDTRFEVEVAQVSACMIQVSYKSSSKIVLMNDKKEQETTISTTILQDSEPSLGCPVLVPVYRTDSEEEQRILNYLFDLVSIQAVIEEAQEYDMDIKAIYVSLHLCEYKIIFEPVTEMVCYHNGIDFDYKDKETQYMVIKKLGEEAKFQEFEHHKFNGQRIIYKDGCYSPLLSFVQVNIFSEAN